MAEFPFMSNEAQVQAKLLALHERLESKDQELDETRIELDAVKAKLSALEKQNAVDEASRSKFDWIKNNPAMTTALIGVLAGIGTTAENLWSRYLDEQEEIRQLESIEKNDQVDDQSVGKLAELMVARQAEVEDTCIAYVEAIMSSMPTYQKRKINRWLSDNDIEPILVSNPTEEAAAGILAHPAPVPTEIKASSNLYEEIQKQVEIEEDVPIEKLQEKLKDKLGNGSRKHRRSKLKQSK